MRLNEFNNTDSQDWFQPEQGGKGNSSKLFKPTFVHETDGFSFSQIIVDKCNK